MSTKPRIFILIIDIVLID